MVAHRVLADAALPGDELAPQLHIPHLSHVLRPFLPLQKPIELAY
jgi:hypothetical protein